MDELLRWREEFPILAKTTYLISNSLGAMPRAVQDRLRQYTDVWAARGVRAWHEGWWEMAVETGDRVGRLIGARPGEISLHQNVTIIQAILASCFNLRGRRNKIVMSDLEFPSTIYFYLEQRRNGARVEIVRSGNPLRIPMDKLLQAIDERTLLVPISLVLFRSATIVEIKRIIERAHEVGALVVLDLFQAAGTMPVDVRALDADFATGGVLKWLCGGPGVGYSLRSGRSPQETQAGVHGMDGGPAPLRISGCRRGPAAGFISFPERHAADSSALCLPARASRLSRPSAWAQSARNRCGRPRG